MLHLRLVAMSLTTGDKAFGNSSAANHQPPARVITSPAAAASPPHNRACSLHPVQTAQGLKPISHPEHPLMCSFKKTDNMSAVAKHCSSQPASL